MIKTGVDCDRGFGHADIDSLRCFGQCRIFFECYCKFIEKTLGIDKSLAHALAVVGSEFRARMPVPMLEEDYDCFGNIDPNKNECVPHCKCFLECYNEMQRQVCKK